LSPITKHIRRFHLYSSLSSDMQQNKIEHCHSRTINESETITQIAHNIYKVFTK